MTNQSSEPHLYFSATKDAAETKYSSNVRGSQGHFNRLSKKKNLCVCVIARISGPPSAIFAIRLSHPLHGSLLPPGICYTCDVCGKTLSTKESLKRHKEQQHFQPLNSAVCALCHKVFRTLNSLNNHKSLYHRRKK
ncbi:zinc finger and BTB domain-containing protein 42-like [Temnothorax curvispinosus]|uniref:Zinc finger and BTB domain-containing protein 42-like n=1 Tax=Temnothorax curvispinosus TaxID=300111 RepID=A0A6J1PHC5_9HYME|nr:zinc finger and BTB domain-containing protein 42-like [Temnothorax curvispinosus]